VSGANGSGPVRVALLNPTYWPEVRRGSERFARDLADGLLELGDQPTLITSHRGRRSRTVEDGLEVIRVWRMPGEGRLRRRMWEDHLLHIPASRAALDQLGPDVAHALYPTDGMTAAKWARATGNPAVLSYMGIPHHQGLANRRSRLEITVEATRGASAVVALSQAAADGFKRWLGIDARVIAPGVDLETFTPGGERSERPTVLCAADAAQPRKRVDLLIEAMEVVRRGRRDARLVVSRPRDAAVAGRLSGIEGVDVVDLDDTMALADANRAAWVAALPSIGEAFGLVLLEALACGTPVVGSAREAIPELVDRPQLGRTFSGDEPGALAAALLEALELAEDPATPAACRERAEEFPRERTAREYDALYRELLAR
jgi:glycosyltransferase involved in cell wall biosynthesis